MRSEVVVTCDGVSKAFGSLRAVDGVTLTIERGEVLGLVGPNGSGKSSLINLISGHTRPDTGRIAVRGRRTDNLPGHRIAGLGLARTYQIPRPFSTMTVWDNVKAGALFGTAHEGDLDVNAEVQRWLTFTGLERHAMSPVGSLTLHQRKFLELARALASRPHVLLLDEVLAGLNANEIEVAIDLVRRVVDGGVTVMLVEHLMRAVRGLCTRLIVLNAGSIIAEGPPEQCLNEPHVIEAYLGRRHA